MLPLASPFSLYPHPFHSLLLTSQDKIWPAIDLGQAPIVVYEHPSTMTLTLAPQIDVHMYEWCCPNCNMGQYSWLHRRANSEEL